MTAPLLLTIDPGDNSAVVLSEAIGGERPARVLLVRTIEKTPNYNEWASSAFRGFEDVFDLVGRRPFVGWYEATPGNPKNGGASKAKLDIRRGMLIQAACGAGLNVSRLQSVTTGTWTMWAGVGPKKVDSGLHRVDEALRLADIDPAMLRGLGGCEVDASEAVLMAVGLARMTLGIGVGRVKAKRARKAGRRAA